jgi:hypothetical protein
MNTSTPSENGIVDQTPTALFEYTTPDGRRYRIGFYTDGEMFERIEAVREGDQWRPIGSERVTNLCLRVFDSDPGIGTQEGVER